VIDLLRKQLRPEFLNRIDDIIVFHALNREEIAQIVSLQFERIRKKLDANGVDLSLSPAAKEYLARHGYQPEFGARPLKRLMQKEIINELAKKILQGEVKRDDKILVDFKQGGLVFSTNV